MQVDNPGIFDGLETWHSKALAKEVLRAVKKTARKLVTFFTDDIVTFSIALRLEWNMQPFLARTSLELSFCAHGL